MYVVTFVEFIPEPRFDNISWMQVEIAEAATEEGPYTLIDTLSIVPDIDPAHPAPRSFTTNNATLQNGWYVVTFLDLTGNDRSQVSPVHFDNSGEISWSPSVLQVARKILSRTRDQYGNMVGTFSNITTPTDTQVAAIVGDVQTEIADVVGDDLPEPLWNDAQNVVALRAAMQIETDFYSEQMASNRSAYPMLEKQYADALAKLQNAVETYGDDGSVDSSSPGRVPSYSFPEPTSWMKRRM